MSIARPRIAVVVGSGGLKCAAAIGLWKVLAREKIDVDLFVGCSGGSIYTAAMAQHLPIADAIEFNRRFADASLFRKKRYRSLLQAVAPRMFGGFESFSILDDGAVNRLLAELFGDATFEQLPVPLHIVATDLQSGEKVTISSGLVRDAVRASLAIPVLLPAWEIEGRRLVDGGASDPLPVAVAIREGAEIIIAMGFENPVVPVIDSAARLLLQASAITVNHLLKSTFAFYSLAHHAELISIMPYFDRPVRLTDGHLVPWLIEQGELAAEREMPYLKRLLASAAENRPAAAEAS
jgi:NTE family protein